MSVLARTGPGGAGAHIMMTGGSSATACVNGPLRRPPAALDPRLLRQFTHTNPRSPSFFGTPRERNLLCPSIDVIGHITGIR